MIKLGVIMLWEETSKTINELKVHYFEEFYGNNVGYECLVHDTFKRKTCEHNEDIIELHACRLQSLTG